MAQQGVHIFEFLGVSLYCLIIVALCVQPTFSYSRCDRITRITSSKNLQVNLPFGNEKPCLQTYQAPIDHKIGVECNLENLDCQKDTFHFYNDIHGDVEKSCGVSNFTRISFLSTVSIMLESNITRARSVECYLSVLAPRDTCSCGWYYGNENEDEHRGNPSAVSIVKAPGNDGVFPYWELICTGIIISHYYVLTSATCLTNVTFPENLLAYTNDASYKPRFDDIKDYFYEVEEIYKHRDYNPKTKINDISILKTARPIEWTKRIGPVCLPNVSDVLKNVTNVDIIGYIKNFKEQRYEIQKRNVEITPFSIHQNFSLSQFSFEGNMTQQELCAYGGPVILNSVFGQMLFGIMGNKDCTPHVQDQRSEQLNIATDIIAHYRWIFAVTGGDYCLLDHAYL